LVVKDYAGGALRKVPEEFTQQVASTHPRIFTGLTLAWGYDGKVLGVSLLEENVRGQIGLVVD
jgi:hypothetical protein